MNYNELNFDYLSRERELSMSAAFPVLMRKVYVWMTLALVLTGVTAYGVATSPGILNALYSNHVGKFPLSFSVQNELVMISFKKNFNI